MHTRQGVAAPALSEHSNPASQPDSYELDSQRRAQLHAGFWSEEPLTAWQEFILCRELSCSGPAPRPALHSVRPAFRIAREVPA